MRGVGEGEGKLATGGQRKPQEAEGSGSGVWSAAVGSVYQASSETAGWPHGLM